MAASQLRSFDLRRVLARLKGAWPFSFDGSQEYWQRRYQKGGTSGSGSYGRLAEFKATLLNRFIADHQLSSVLELGCGDGAQVSLLHCAAYVGVDVAPASVSMCRERFANDPARRFFHASERDAFATERYDLTLSLDVLYHLVEDSVYAAYLDDLFGLARHHVIIYSSNKNDYNQSTPHVRHRRFTDDVAARFPDWKLREHVPNAYPFDPNAADGTSFADFYIYSHG
jgi:SAM-dependent methyltransferase